MTTFRVHDDVAVVECDATTGKPIEGGTAVRATVIQAGGIYVEIRYENGSKAAYYQESGWRAWHGGEVRRRLVPFCHRCELPILGTPVTDPDDPLDRKYCRDECRDADAEAWAAGHYGAAVAT